MRVFSLILTYCVFFLLLSIGTLFLRNGDGLVSSLIRVKHSSKEGPALSEFVNTFVSEFKHVVDQVVTNTLSVRINSLNGLKYISKSKFSEIFKCNEGEELSLFELSELKKSLAGYPWIKSFNVSQKFYPERVDIEIIEAKPAFIADYLGSSWIVSDEGVLLDETSSILEPELSLELMELPRLLNLEPAVEDQNTYLSSYLERLRYVIRNYQNIDLAGGFPFKISTLTLIPGGGIKAETMEGNPPLSLLFDVKSFDEARILLERLKAVKEDLKLKGDPYRELDFRFQDQVIKR